MKSNENIECKNEKKKKRNKNIEIDEIVHENIKKEKKKKSKNSCDIELVEKKKKKKHREIIENGSDTEIKKKKKKKKKHRETNENDTEIKKKKKNSESDSDIEINKKKKKKKKLKEISEENSDKEVSDKKKKKKHDEVSDIDTEKKKKKKKRKLTDIDDQNSDSEIKKKKKRQGIIEKNHSDEKVTSHCFQPPSSYNSPSLAPAPVPVPAPAGDEVAPAVHGKNVRCKGFKDSEKKNLGQWASVEMDDSRRLSKFARLLGGKKAQATSTGDLSASNHASMAMSAGKERQLNATLTRQFDAALELRKQPASAKSGGLGYSAPPEQGKKFYIDNSASKSKKFF